MFRVILVLTTLFVASQSSIAQTSEDSQIKETIQAYIDGFNKRDRRLLEEAFAVENAHMKSISTTENGEDRVRVTKIQDWIEKATAEGANRNAKVKILSITMVNDRIANVFLDFDGALFDMMLVAKIDNRWKILNKVSIYQDAGK